MEVTRFIGVNDIVSNNLEWRLGPFQPGDRVYIQEHPDARHWYVLPKKTKWDAAHQYGTTKFDRVYKISGRLRDSVEMHPMLKGVEVLTEFTIIEEVTDFSDPMTIDWTQGAWHGWGIVIAFPEYINYMPVENKAWGPPPYASHLFE